jgi:hypothetical protein
MVSGKELLNAEPLGHGLRALSSINNSKRITEKQIAVF